MIHFRSDCGAGILPAEVWAACRPIGGAMVRGFIIWGAVSLSLAVGQETGQRTNASSWVQQAQQTPYQEITVSSIVARRDLLARRIAELDRFLAGGEAKNSARWRDYLRWNDLAKVVQGDPLTITPEAQGVAARLYSGEPGLEFPPFVAVREALTSYANLATARAQQPFDDVFEERRQRLIAAIEAYQAERSTAARVELLEQLSWFQNLGQMPRLVSEIRKSHQRPNLMIRLSQGFVSHVVERDVHEVSPVRDVILGTRVAGVATTVGRVSAGLIPSADRVGIQLLLVGQATTRSIGHQRPVEIRSTSSTQIAACQALFLDPGGAQLGTTDANCRTRTNIHSISAQNRMGQRLIEKIAWRRAAQQKPLAEAVASRKAEGRVERMFRGQALPLVDQANSRLRDEVRQPLSRRNLYPREIHFSTTTNAVYGRIKQARSDQWSSATAPPSITGRAGLTLQVHETLFNNTAETAISGFKLTDERAAEIMRELTGSVPDELVPAPDKDPWSITFAIKRPLQVSFSAERIEISLEGREFTRGDRVLDQPIRIAANYRPQVTDQGLLLERIGDLQVTFPGREGERLGVREVTFKTFMETKFREVFKERIQGEGLQLPGRLARSGRHRLAELSSADGWIELGWN
jgi:hypothetical protein